MHARNISLVLGTVCATLGCNTLASKPLDELRPPGFVDVGAGYAVAFDTRGGADDDADGFLLTLKAYPYGRWYSKPNTTSQQILKNAADLVVDQQLGKSAVGVLESTQQLEARIDEALAAMDPSASGEAEVEADYEECQSCIQGAGDQVYDVPSLYGFTDKVTDSLAQASKALKERDSNTAKLHLEQAKAALPSNLSEIESERESESRRLIRSLTRAEDNLLNEDFYEVADGNRFRRFARRLSIFYGTSVNEFDGGGLDSQVNAVGVAFDVAPQMAIAVGYGFYDVDNEVDNGWIASVSLNLAAFRWFFADLAD